MHMAGRVILIMCTIRILYTLMDLPNVPVLDINLAHDLNSITIATHIVDVHASLTVAPFADGMGDHPCYL